MNRHRLQIRSVAALVGASLVVALGGTAQARPTVEPREVKTTRIAVEAQTGTADVLSGLPANNESAAVAQTESGQVAIPLTDAGKVTVQDGQTRVEIGLPPVAGAKGYVTDSGTIVYAGSAKSANLALQPTTAGVRALVYIKDATASKEYRFPVTVPAGGRLATSAELVGQEYDTGEVFVLDAANQVVGGFDAAWAKDAKGAPVTTSYRVEGNTLIQVVSFDASTAFPVIADPNWWKIAKCAGALAWLVGSTAVAWAKILKIRSYIKALGGFRKAAELMAKASTWEERLKYGGQALLNLAAEIAGIAGVREHCFNKK